MKIPLNALLVEDVADDAELLARELQKNGFDLKWKRVETEAEYRAHLGSGCDIIFSDFGLPQFSTMRALELLREAGLDLPFIIVSGTIGEEHAVECMKAGATDYVLKDRLHRLGPVVARALREVRERTERKRMEAQFIEAQKMEVVGHLAGGIAHDFNNVIGVIICYSDLLLTGPVPEESLRDWVEEIRHAAHRASALTRQLLVFSRNQRVQPVVLGLDEVTKDLDKMLHRLIDENIELSIVHTDQVGKIKADPGQIGQVIMNLVINARDAMPNGGKLKIETANAVLDETFTPTQGGAKPGGHVRLTVSDTGIGMTPEVKAHLFEPLFTTKPKGKGTGLGLATCQTIVNQSGGCIEVQSESGRGTTFNIYFPRVEKPLDATAQPVREKPLMRGTETLLVVEDEPALRQMACTILKSHGYTVLSANNGQDGLRVVREHAQGAPIRLVVTDVIMPQMNGPVMAQWLQATYPDLKILYTSGYTDNEIGEHGVLEPGVAFLPKPYTPATLTQKVRELLDK